MSGIKLAVAILAVFLVFPAVVAHWPHEGPTGRFNVLIVRVDFEDAPGVLYSQTEFRDVWAPQLEQYFEQVSNENLDVHLTVLDDVVTLGLRFRYHWLCAKFFPAGPLRAWECRSVAEAADLAQDAGYIDELPEGLAPVGGGAADVFDGIMVVLGAPLDFPYGGAFHLNSCGSGFRANSGSPACVNKDDPRSGCAGNVYPGRYGFMTVSEDGDEDCSSTDPFDDIGPAMHELGHSITSHNASDNGAHPAGYGNNFELLDSCYPCQTGVFTRVSPAVKGPGFKLYFPGWLDDSKVTQFAPPTGGTEVLDPIEMDPDESTAPMGLRVGAGDGTAYWVECRKRIDEWDGVKPIPDEGVVILHAVPGATEDPYETTFVSPPPSGSNSDAWEPGETFFDSLNDVTIAVGPDIGDGCTVTVDYGPLSLAGVPDIGMTPWLTPPNRTWETVDIWVDSSCNRYEADGGVLRYGRDMSGDVIDNGDDPCANAENRIYARVRNYGTGVANDVEVDFYVTNPLGVGIRDAHDWTMVGTADKTSFPAELTSIPPGGVVEVWVPWIPIVESPPEGTLTFPFHSCLQVKMNTVAGERVLTNQDGDREQENISHFEVPREPLGGYPTIERFITLTNPDGHETLRFTIRPTTDIPAGWEVEIGSGQSIYWLSEAQTVKVPVRISAPDAAPTGQRVVVEVAGFREERFYDDNTGELLHWSEHEVGGVMLALRTVEQSTFVWSAKAEPAESCSPQLIIAEGCLTPPLAGVPIAVTYLEPSGTQTTNVTFTDSGGCFYDDHLPNGGGQIRVSVLWQGDLTNSSVAAAQTVSAATPGDMDCDQIPDGSDNCDGVMNPGQADVDGDGTGDDCDCAPNDPGAEAPPGEIGDFVWDDSDRMVWESDFQAGDSTVYEVIRGAVIDLPLGANYNETCLVTMVNAPTFTDIEIPEAGQSFSYLVRGINACGTGTLGSRSSGLERQTIVNCPTCAHDKCDTGVLLDPACDDCVHNICDVDPYCCETQWDSTCESEVRTVCGSLVCDESQGSCSHTLCSEGAALGNSCDVPPAGQSCVDLICASDAYCCETLWDDLCVEEVETICGNNCY